LGEGGCGDKIAVISVVLRGSKRGAE